MKLKKRLSLLLVVLLLGLSLTGCATTQTAEQPQETEQTPAQSPKPETSGQNDGADETVQSPIIITDIEGRTIELEKPAERIIDCTALGGSRVLVQLEAEDLLVGVSDNVLSAVNNQGMGQSAFHPVSIAAPQLAELPVIGKYNEPNIETIMSLDPDVILIGWGGEEQAESLLKQTGIPTVCINRMDGHFDYDIYEIMGKVIGKEDKAKELITYAEETISVVTDVTDEIPEEEKKSLYFWIYPTMESSPRSNGIYDAFDYAGAINVASNDEGIALYEMTKEQIAAWDADFIFLQSYIAAGSGFYTCENIKDDPIMQNTQAVMNGNVYYLRGPISDWDTAIEVTEVLYVAKILYPDMFADLDVEAYGEEIMKTFYGVDGLYAKMSEFVGLYNWD